MSQLAKRGSTISDLKARFQYAPPSSRDERGAAPPQRKFWWQDVQSGGMDQDKNRPPLSEDELSDPKVAASLAHLAKSHPTLYKLVTSMQREGEGTQDGGGAGRSMAGEEAALRALGLSSQGKPPPASSRTNTPTPAPKPSSSSTAPRPAAYQPGDPAAGVKAQGEEASSAVRSSVDTLMDRYRGAQPAVEKPAPQPAKAAPPPHTAMGAVWQQSPSSSGILPSATSDGMGATTRPAFATVATAAVPTPSSTTGSTSRRTSNSGSSSRNGEGVLPPRSQAAPAVPPLPAPRVSGVSGSTYVPPPSMYDSFEFDTMPVEPPLPPNQDQAAKPPLPARQQAPALAVAVPPTPTEAQAAGPAPYPAGPALAPTLQRATSATSAPESAAPPPTPVPPTDPTVIPAISATPRTKLSRLSSSSGGTPSAGLSVHVPPPPPDGGSRHSTPSLAATAASPSGGVTSPSVVGLPAHVPPPPSDGGRPSTTQGSDRRTRSPSPSRGSRGDRGAAEAATTGPQPSPRSRSGSPMSRPHRGGQGNSGDSDSPMPPPPPGMERLYGFATAAAAVTKEAGGAAPGVDLSAAVAADAYKVISQLPHAAPGSMGVGALKLGGGGSFSSSSGSAGAGSTGTVAVKPSGGGGSFSSSSGSSSAAGGATGQLERLSSAMLPAPPASPAPSAVTPAASAAAQSIPCTTGAGASPPPPLLGAEISFASPPPTATAHPAAGLPAPLAAATQPLLAPQPTVRTEPAAPPPATSSAPPPPPSPKAAGPPPGMTSAGPAVAATAAAAIMPPPPTGAPAAMAQAAAVPAPTAVTLPPPTPQPPPPPVAQASAAVLAALPTALAESFGTARRSVQFSSQNEIREYTPSVRGSPASSVSDFGFSLPAPTSSPMLLPGIPGVRPPMIFLPMGPGPGGCGRSSDGGGRPGGSGAATSAEPAIPQPQAQQAGAAGSGSGPTDGSSAEGLPGPTHIFLPMGGSGRPQLVNIPGHKQHPLPFSPPSSRSRTPSPARRRKGSRPDAEPPAHAAPAPVTAGVTEVAADRPGRDASVVLQSSELPAASGGTLATQSGASTAPATSKGAPVASTPPPLSASAPAAAAASPSITAASVPTPVSPAAVGALAAGASVTTSVLEETKAKALKQVEAEAATRPRTRITRLVEEVETFRKNGREISIRNEEKAKLQLEKYLGKQAGVIMEWRKLQYDTNTSKRMHGIEQGKVFLAKAKEFESAALESALAAQLEREGMQEQLRNQQQLLEDTVQEMHMALRLSAHNTTIKGQQLGAVEVAAAAGFGHAWPSSSNGDAFLTAADGISRSHSDAAAGAGAPHHPHHPGWWRELAAGRGLSLPGSPSAMGGRGGRRGDAAGGALSHSTSSLSPQPPPPLRGVHFEDTVAAAASDSGVDAITRAARDVSSQLDLVLRELLANTGSGDMPRRGEKAATAGAATTTTSSTSASSSSSSDSDDDAGSDGAAIPTSPGTRHSPSRRPRIASAPGPGPFPGAGPSPHRHRVMVQIGSGPPPAAVDPHFQAAVGFLSGGGGGGGGLRPIELLPPDLQSALLQHHLLYPPASAQVVGGFPQQQQPSAAPMAAFMQQQLMQKQQQQQQRALMQPPLLAGVAQQQPATAPLPFPNWPGLGSCPGAGLVPVHDLAAAYTAAAALAAAASLEQQLQQAQSPQRRGTAAAPQQQESALWQHVPDANADYTSAAPPAATMGLPSATQQQQQQPEDLSHTLPPSATSSPRPFIPAREQGGGGAAPPTTAPPAASGSGPRHGVGLRDAFSAAADTQDGAGGSRSVRQHRRGKGEAGGTLGGVDVWEGLVAGLAAADATDAGGDNVGARDGGSSEGGGGEVQIGGGRSSTQHIDILTLEGRPYTSVDMLHVDPSSWPRAAASPTPPLPQPVPAAAAGAERQPYAATTVDSARTVDAGRAAAVAASLARMRADAGHAAAAARSPARAHPNAGSNTTSACSPARARVDDAFHAAQREATTALLPPLPAATLPPPGSLVPHPTLSHSLQSSPARGHTHAHQAPSPPGVTSMQREASREPQQQRNTALLPLQPTLGTIPHPEAASSVPSLRPQQPSATCYTCYSPTQSTPAAAVTFSPPPVGTDRNQRRVAGPASGTAATTTGMTYSSSSEQRPECSASSHPFGPMLSTGTAEVMPLHIIAADPLPLQQQGYYLTASNPQAAHALPMLSVTEQQQQQAYSRSSQPQYAAFHYLQQQLAGSIAASIQQQPGGGYQQPLPQHQHQQASYVYQQQPPLSRQQQQMPYLPQPGLQQLQQQAYSSLSRADATMGFVMQEPQYVQRGQQQHMQQGQTQQYNTQQHWHPSSGYGSQNLNLMPPPAAATAAAVVHPPQQQQQWAPSSTLQPQVAAAAGVADQRRQQWAPSSTLQPQVAVVQQQAWRNSTPSSGLPPPPALQQQQQQQGYSNQASHQRLCAVVANAAQLFSNSSSSSAAAGMQFQRSSITAQQSTFPPRSLQQHQPQQLTMSGLQQSVAAPTAGPQQGGGRNQPPPSQPQQQQLYDTTLAQLQAVFPVAGGYRQ